MAEQQNTNSKIVTISFMMAAILIGIVMFVFIESTAAVATGSLGRFAANELVRHGVPVAFGIVAFFILQFNKGTLAWADDVVSELRKIVWPSRKDTVAMTVMVCVMLLISGIVLGLYDVIGGTLIDWLLHHNILGLIS